MEDNRKNEEKGYRAERVELERRADFRGARDKRAADPSKASTSLGQRCQRSAGPIGMERMAPDSDDLYEDGDPVSET